MKSSLECLPCLAKNAVDFARRSTDDPEIRHRITAEAFRMLADADLTQTPPYHAGEIMKMVQWICPQDRDLYRQEKDRSTQMAKQLAAKLDSIPEYDPDRFESRLRLAIAGNILDFGIFTDLDLDEAIRSVRQAFTKPIDLSAAEKLHRRMDSAKKILYVLDNCGEAVFDRVFMEPYLDRITVAVRGSNSMNDVTRADLAMSGFDPAVTPVVDTGSCVPGLIFEQAPPELRRIMEEADLIIAKGQGNFETLNEIPYPASFLFMAKCPVVIRMIQAELRSIQIRNINF